MARPIADYLPQILRRAVHGEEHPGVSKRDARWELEMAVREAVAKASKDLSYAEINSIIAKLFGEYKGWE